MIDFLKILIIDQHAIATIRSNPLLVWNESNEKLWLDKETIRAKETYDFDGIYFCFYERKLEILFKPHYFYNRNLHNANDFPIVDCIDIMNQFITLFEINPKDARIINLEYGLNVISPIDVEDLITYMIYHGRNPFAPQNGLRFSKISSSSNRRGKTSTYKQIKGYAKTLQVPDKILSSECIDPNTFRFEIKSKRSAYINKLGINTIADLLVNKVYLNLENCILKEFSEVFIVDYSATPEMTLKERNDLDRMLNPNTWYQLENHKNRNRFSRTKRKYYDIVSRDPKNLKGCLTEIMVDKLLHLRQGVQISHSPSL